MDIFAPICLSELKEKSELIAKLVPPKQNNATNSASHLFDLSNLHINELFRDNASKLICRIKLVVDYVHLNPIRIIDEKKEDRIEDIFLSFGEEYEELITRAFKMSEDGKNEEMFDLWKHYQYDIERVIGKILPAISYLQEIKSIHYHLSDNNKAGDFELYNKRNLKREKLSAMCIALLHYYNDEPITIYNIDEIMLKYGYRAKQTLLDLYEEVKVEDFRIESTVLKKSCDAILSKIKPEKKEKVLDEMDRSQRLKKSNKNKK
ncbi:hypothetical protein [Labilibaculum sp.]|uniref:hypothetical protein n=1 Tax=Labilibaculum sp. TaxID=2060723 RepID=UPI002AA7E6AF|nr:hypothetical protein [Labilibaculum sp.]